MFVLLRLGGGGDTSVGETEEDPPAATVVMFGPAPNPNAKPKGFFCGVCGEHVASVSEEKHSSSTLHIFNQQHRPPERKVKKSTNCHGNEF